MKLPQKKSNRIILITIATLALLGLGATTYVYAFNGSILGWNNKQSRSVNDVDYGNTTDEQSKAGEEIEKSNQNSDPNKVGSDRPLDPDTNTDGKSTVPIVITAASQNGTTAQIRTLISATVNDGTCTLTLSMGGKTVTRSVGVQALPSTATCKGFDIPVSELSTGKWSVTVVYESTSIKSSATSSITIQEQVQQ